MNIKKIDNYRWEVTKTGCMNVPGIVYSDEKLLKLIEADKSLEQVANVACLPGIIKYSLAMPDIHWGYGFPIGGVAAFDYDNGVISPGGVGYDINCGVRLLKTDISAKDARPKIKELLFKLFNEVPTGVGSSGAINKLSVEEMKKVCEKGAKWAVEKGFGDKEDLERIEEYGVLDGANTDNVSPRAFERGRDQVGTLGSGNHFLEIDIVEKIFNERIADVFGLKEGYIAVLIHTGSRGFGYQICDDYLVRLKNAQGKYGLNPPDRQLACAPIKSREGQDYYSAMACAVNYARANRQVISSLVKNVFEKFFGLSFRKLGMYTVYDVAHNIAKFEEHEVDGVKKKLCVHRKGATRAFPAGHPQVPEIYKNTGQPVLIPGDMGRSSYVLVGTEKAMNETFGSTCHGAGRVMSRTEAVKRGKGRSISNELEQQGVIVLAKDKGTLAEEMPSAYKSVDDVVNVVDKSGISMKIVRLVPIGVIKG